MIVLILCTIVLVLYALELYMKNSRFGRLLEKIPGPKGHPILGNLITLIKSPDELFYQNRKWNSLYKDIYKIRSGQYGVVVLNHPDDLEILLSSTKCIKKDLMYDLFHPWLGDGLLMSYGEKWHKRRKLLTPAFHFNILKDACKIFQEQSVKFVDILKEKIGTEIDLPPIITEFTLHSITESAMGQKLQDDDNKIARYKQNVYDMGQCFIYRCVRIWLATDFVFGLSKVGKFQKKIIKELQGFTGNVINERRNNGNIIKLEGDSLELSNDDGINKKKRLAMLDLMLAMEKKGAIDQSGIQEEVDTFMFEGHDTTTSAITFLLMNLANHPDIQEQVVDELRNIFLHPEQKCTMDEMNKMSYLEWCIKESLRLYPSVHFFSRELTEDLQTTSYLIPKGTCISIMPFDIHRRPDFFPNPLLFDPNRFSPENSLKRHPYSYIPFSAGPRNCIGQKFAMFEMKSITATILRNFTLLPVTKPNDIEFTTDLVLRARHPIKIKIAPRTDPF